MKKIELEDMMADVKKNVSEQKEVRTVALEDLMADTVLWFCENLAELGCPKNAESDMWFREISPKERSKIMGKLLDIMERDTKRFEEENKEEKPFCPKCDRSKMKKGKGKVKTLIGCKDLTKKQWEDGFTVDKDQKFSQKNCPELKN